jgi:hypothetical protein
MKNRLGNSHPDFVNKISFLSKSKHAQITIFIILALILIVGIFFIFLLRQTPKIEIVSEENPQAFIEKCTRDAVEEALDLLMIHSGSLEPKGTIMYQGENITYLCYNSLYYRPCVNQQPLLIEHIEDEIYKYVKPRLSNCFQVLKTSLEPRYEVSMEEDWDLTTKLTSSGVEININRDFKMQRGDKVISFSLFKINLIHPIYRLAEIAMEIVNAEASYCNFDTLGFMIIYPRYDISKFRIENSNTIYSVKEITSNKMFRFAVRSCAIPPGF